MKYIFLFYIFFISCGKHITPENHKNMPVKYLALGDSYTIGEAVPAQKSFPYQLVQKLKDKGVNTGDPHIIATTGWTTDDLIAAIKKENIQSKYGLVTLLIGVNNQYRGYSTSNYRLEFKELLETAVSYADGQRERVFVISIPDWGVTPFAKKSGRNLQKISTQIDAFNLINKEEALKAGVEYVDITPGSRKADTDLTLIAEDGLHPSAKMYADWAQQLSLKILK